MINTTAALASRVLEIEDLSAWLANDNPTDNLAADIFRAAREQRANGEYFGAAGMADCIADNDAVALRAVADALARA